MRIGVLMSTNERLNEQVDKTRSLKFSLCAPASLRQNIFLLFVTVSRSNPGGTKVSESTIYPSRYSHRIVRWKKRSFPIFPGCFHAKP